MEEIQETRKSILDYLKEHGQATVDELAEVLNLTPVTVRHHLDILRSKELVSEPQVRRRSSPGRPQYVFALTPKASAHFPKNYAALAANVLAEIRAHSPHSVNVIFEGVAQRLSAEAPHPRPGESIAERLDRAVDFLNQHGYVAHWEKTPEGYVLHTSNCPYEALAANNPELCRMDMTVVSNLLGFSLKCRGRLAEGSGSCSYLIPETELLVAQPE